MLAEASWYSLRGGVQGRTTRTDFANTTYALNSYDTANRISEIQIKNSGGTQLSDIEYAYDGVKAGECEAEGRFLGPEQTDTDGAVTSFGYDAVKFRPI